MKNAFRIIISLLPFLYMGLIWFLSSNPDDLVVELKSSRIDSFMKESLHLIEFAILYLLFAAALKVNGRLTPALNMMAAIAAGLYGVLDEYHQSFIPSRSSSLIDVIKDVTGVIIAWLLVKRGARPHIPFISRR
ncbi:VanZ family protein [Peribacillus sp. SCS-37]|uniref:VanZ family protein n=1 Tax=Paraperibacillus esterisolvens TaxID=3115296 RepID=UPI003906AB51